MGFQTEFNWVLKLKPEQGLDEPNLKVNQTYSFLKSDARIYPISIPIELFNQSWEAVAKIIITEFTNKSESVKTTSGRYKVLKIYQGDERDMLTKHCKEWL